MSGESFPVQVPKYAFPENFDIKFSKNCWPNTKKAISFFKKVAFTHFKNVRQTIGFPNEQTYYESLVIMDTFKGQDNEEAAKLCHENNCVLIIALHNLTNKSQ